MGLEMSMNITIAISIEKGKLANEKIFIFENAQIHTRGFPGIGTEQPFMHSPFPMVVPPPPKPKDDSERES